MNIAAFVASLNPFDLLVAFALFGLFVLGFIQGTIRRLLGIAAILFSFLIAANLRQPLGGFLAANWTHLEDSYAVMIGFGTVFIAASIAFTVLIQAIYKKAPLFRKYVVVDELIGGMLGVVQGLLVLGIVIVILDSHFRIPGVQARNELPLLRETYQAYDQSVTAGALREHLIPGFLAILGPFIPEALRALFPAGGSPVPST